MPRLSVDIDLTYVPISDRKSSFSEIVKALEKIERRLKKIKPDLITSLQKQNLKLQIMYKGAQIKIEVNQINRGCISESLNQVLCIKAQEMFDAFCEINTVPNSQLFGGKIIAALDRQHPRDMFDIKYLIDEGGMNDDIKPGFIFCLLSSNRPIYELLNPKKKDQRQAFENQFAGMSDEPFSYEDFEKTRDELIVKANELLNNEDKAFIFNFKRLTPDWPLYNFKDFPAVKWKLKNLERFKESNKDGYNKALERLASYLQ
jgi:predicted nucleotidyltransferase component of viral defense system